MPRYDFTRHALEDLKGIARYTRTTWEEKQARRYRQELELSIQKLCLSPGLGRSREDIGPSVHSFPVGRHVAYYVQHEDGITVLRLLHSSMDADRAFESTQDGDID